MALSALSAGLLISCVKPADDNKAADNDSQTVAQESTATNDTNNAAANESNSSEQNTVITPVDIRPATEKRYLTHVTDTMIIPAYADATKQSEVLHDLAQNTVRKRLLAVMSYKHYALSG